MIFTILLAADTPMQVAPSPPASDDIVVIGQRLKNLRIVTKKNRRTVITRCALKPLSGYPGLDAGVCDAYLTCIPKFDTARALEACMKPLITDLEKKLSALTPNRVEEAR